MRALVAPVPVRPHPACLPDNVTFPRKNHRLTGEWDRFLAAYAVRDWPPKKGRLVASLAATECAPGCVPLLRPCYSPKTLPADSLANCLEYSSQDPGSNPPD